MEWMIRFYSSLRMLDIREDSRAPFLRGLRSAVPPSQCITGASLELQCNDLLTMFDFRGCSRPQTLLPLFADLIAIFRSLYFVPRLVA